VAAGLCIFIAFLPNVMFTDDCAVYLSARSQNVCIRVKPNPHFFEEVAQHPPPVMMWAGVTSELIIRPYLFDVFVTGEIYLDLLSHWLILELDNVGLLNSVILQQDMPPDHYAADMHTVLISQFPL
jgi:hypothetical protein